MILFFKSWEMFICYYCFFLNLLCLNLEAFCFSFHSFQITYFTLMSFTHLDLMGLLFFCFCTKWEVEMETHFSVYGNTGLLPLFLKKLSFFPVHAFYNSIKYYMVIDVEVYSWFLILLYLSISVSEFDFCANASFLLHGSLVWNPYTEIHWSMFFWFKSVLITCGLSTLSVLVYEYSSVEVSSEILYDLHSIGGYIVGNITIFSVLMLKVYEHGTFFHP